MIDGVYVPPLKRCQCCSDLKYLSFFDHGKQSNEEARDLSKVCRNCIEDYLMRNRMLPCTYCKMETTEWVTVESPESVTGEDDFCLKCAVMLTVD
jgi:hypothetical protein